jgi:hypothetical protein
LLGEVLIFASDQFERPPLNINLSRYASYDRKVKGHEEMVLVGQMPISHRKDMAFLRVYVLGSDQWPRDLISGREMNVALRFRRLLVLFYRAQPELIRI